MPQVSIAVISVLLLFLPQYFLYIFEDVYHRYKRHLVPQVSNAIIMVYSTPELYSKLLPLILLLEMACKCDVIPEFFLVSCTFFGTRYTHYLCLLVILFMPELTSLYYYNIIPAGPAAERRR